MLRSGTAVGGVIRLPTATECARLMYEQIQNTDLPTWVIGPPQDEEPLPERPADILKVWPHREPVRRLRPDAFNPIMQALARAHCR